ncbi:MAG: hypothetical protein ACMUIM_06770 [bacterium]
MASLVLSLVIVLFSFSQTIACVGARALAMGGAFTGVADDTQATYWNPAGLAKASPGLYTMHNLNHRKEFNYDDYIGLSYSYRQLGVGFEYIKKSTQTKNWILIPGYGIQLGEINEDASWLQIGSAYAFRFVSFGANVRYLEQTYEVSCDLVAPALNIREDDSAMGFDLGCLTEFGPSRKQGTRKMFSAGVLIQDLNEPDLLGQKYITNTRPGLGFRPLDNVLLSLEIYDAAQEYFQEPQIRIGFEWEFSTPYFIEDLALRGGVYHLNNNYLRAFTGGLGYLKPVSDQISLGIDYAFMAWEEARKVTHLLSVVCRF